MASNITRRSILKAAPALAAVAAAPVALAAVPVEDPVLAPYRRWSESRSAWTALMDADLTKPEQSPDVRALMDVELTAFWEITKLTPTTMAGVAAVAHVLWAIDGPSLVTSHPGHEEELRNPEHVLKAAIWRCASGQADVPEI